jgi:hypothetical protein
MRERALPYPSAERGLRLVVAQTDLGYYGEGERAVAASTGEPFRSNGFRCPWRAGPGRSLELTARVRVLFARTHSWLKFGPCLRLADSSVNLCRAVCAGKLEIP